MNSENIETEETRNADLIKWKIFYNKLPIGNFEFLKEKDRHWLNDSSLDEEYQRRGIGSYIISEAVKQFGEIYFCIADQMELIRYYKRYDQRYLTPEGIKFKEALLKKGIIKPDWVKNPCVL